MNLNRRSSGVVPSAAGLIPFGHLGWGYRDRAEFLARAAEYITDDLEFISHRQLVALDDYADDRGRKVVLRSGQRMVSRLVGLLDLKNVVACPVIED